MSKKPNARTFGQDLMRGEHVVGQVGRKAAGAMGMPETARDASFYSKKRAVEKELGRELTTEEFRADYWQVAEDGHASGTSIFDPVLCELAYRWYCPPGGKILDPFAGGSVRGVVAAVLGYEYHGIDLRPEQCAANREQAKEICADAEFAPQWYEGDSAQMEAAIGDEADFDFIFSCPPYADLEVYSEDPRDLSTMDYDAFLAAYETIIAESVRRLKNDRFAFFVVGDVRDPKGFYRKFPWHTVEAFEAAGAKLYNEAVLVTAVGSLPVRVARQFEAGRKLGKTHQNLFVFCKGDPRKATEAIGPVQFGEIPGADEDPFEDEEGEPADDFTPDLTPIEAHGDKWLKRDDLWTIAGVPGGKVRTCWALAQGANGLVTAGSRASPQVNIVAHIAERLGVPCRAHTPQGDLSPEVLAAQATGAEIVQHEAGYNNVIIARAREDAEARGWVEIPFGMECQEAVEQTRRQVAGLPEGVERLVVPVGSGMSLAGILWGMIDAGYSQPVLGVVVGADPEKRLDKFAPPDWRDRVQLVKSPVDYHKAVAASIGGVRLDPHYEAKCAEFLRAGDLLWCVGIRATDRKKAAREAA